MAHEGKHPLAGPGKFLVCEQCEGQGFIEIPDEYKNKYNIITDDTFFIVDIFKLPEISLVEISP